MRIVKFFIIITFLLLSETGLAIINQHKNNVIPFQESNEEYGITVTPKHTYDMVIIAPSLFSDALQPLIHHKNDYMVETFLKTTEEIYHECPGRDNAEQIKYFIKDAFDCWKIKYVMLVGGTGSIPTRLTNICGFDGSWNYYFISDLYYADLYFANGTFCSWDSNNDGLYAGKKLTEKIDSVDYYPDVYVGRLLCSSPAEVETIVEKIITYETNNYWNTSWFNTLVLCGGDDAEAKDEWHFSTIIEEKCRPAWEGEYISTIIGKMLNTFSAKKLFASGLFRPDAQGLTIKNVNDAINKGAGFLLFIGHGSPTNAIATNFPFCSYFRLPFPNGYSQENIVQLTNRNKLPIAIFAGCNCGNFDNESEWGVTHPIAWQFVQHHNGGSIVSFANTWGSNMVMTNLCSEIWTGRLLLGVFESFSQGIDTVGEIWGNSITTYLNDERAFTLGDKVAMWWWRTNHVIVLTIEEWTLFGDPSLKIGGYG